MIQLKNLSKRFGQKELFQDLSWEVPSQERIAITGQNGMGKTTLLKIISGEEGLDDGKVVIQPGKTLGFLKQQLNPNPEPTVQLECESGAEEICKLRQEIDSALAKGEAGIHEWEKKHSRFEKLEGYSLPSRASTILNGLGFSQTNLTVDPLKLSPGWRIRLELAKVLVATPDILVLDEPTNYLDLPSLIWLENFLINYSGTLIFVSHDLELLNRLPTMIANLHMGELEVHKGNFDAFQKWIQIQEETKQATREKLLSQKQHLQGFIDRFGAKASKATQAKSMAKKIEKIESSEQGLKSRTSERKAKVQLPKPTHSSQLIYQIQDGAIGYNKVPVLTNIQINVEKGEKIAIIGANGLGKSTLLRSIFGSLPSCSGRFHAPEHTKIRYFSQQLEDINSNDTVLESMQEVTNLNLTEMRKILGAFLFSEEDISKKVKVLSGGEKSRLGLSRLVAAPANFFLLDEPTNHLDISMCTTLISLIKNWEGTLLFVSHDRNFIRQTATSIFAINSAGESLHYPGSFDEFCNHAAQTGFDTSFSSKTIAEKKNKTKAIVSEKPKSYKISHNEKKRLERDSKKIEEKMQAIQAEIHQLTEQLVDQYSEDIAKKQHLLTSDLEQLEIKWIGIQEELEEN